MLPAGAVAHLRVRSDQSDSAALQLAISHQLGCADLRIPGSSPSEVLLVRALRDPLPGRLTAQPLAPGVDAQWERAIRDKLQNLRAGAARPREGVVDDHPDAVLFSDEAQLIACLALSFVTRDGPSPWWRTSLEPHLKCNSLPELLNARPELLPAVFNTLARWRAEERVAVQLSDGVARDLIEAQTRATGAVLTLEPRPAKELRPWQDAQDQAIRSSAVVKMRAPSNIVSSPDARGSRMPDVRPPWQSSWQPTSAAALSPLQQLLVGFALTMHRVPAWARSREFAQAAQRWLQDHPAAALATVAAEPAPPDGRASWSAAPSPGSDLSPPSLSCSDPPVSGPRLECPPEAQPVSCGCEQPSPEHCPSVGEIATARFAERPRHSRDTPLLSAPNQELGSGRPLPERIVPTGPTAREAAELPSHWSADGVFTGLGGLFYLVHLMDLLDLPDCFEQDCRLASTVGAFGTLEAIARSLLHPLPAELEQDPLWSALAALDMRNADEPPRAEGLITETLHLPPGWLPVGDKRPRTLRWASRDQRFCLWCDDGYPVADVRRTDGPDRQALELANRYLGTTARPLLEVGAWRDRPVDPLPHLEARRWPSALLGWLAFVTPFLRWRLARALGHSCVEDLDPIAEIASLPARVYATDTHIDIVAGLQSIRAPLRLAGLDRSPGWVKQLQRVVLFHFE